MTTKTWFSEASYFGSLKISFEVIKKLHEETSPFQKIEVYETKPVGRLLVLDGKTMISQIDEFVYHEVMSHIPYMCSDKVEKVLIIGGGDGGLVREYARHTDIKKIDLVEIDERVVEVSKEYFPECTQALNDPRVEVHAKDGIEFIKGANAEYDIIVIDSTDPENFAEGLFTKDFYASVNQALTENGIMMAQTENPFLDEYNVKNIYKNLKASFPIVQSTWAPMIIYPGVFWTFAFASKMFFGNKIQETKKERMTEIEKNLKWYNINWHEGAFNLSNFHRQKMGL